MGLELGPCEITGVFGPMASGKTHLINTWLAAQNRYVRFDLTAETLGKPGVETIWGNPLILYRRLKANPYFFRIAYVPEGRNLQSEYHKCLQAVWRVPVFKQICCDEFWKVCPNNAAPEWLDTAMRIARHARVGMIGASQRIADVDKTFTMGCRMTVMFYTQESNDYKAVQERYGVAARKMLEGLRPCIYDDVKKVCKQVPQALVCIRGKAPYVHDFLNDAQPSTEKNACEATEETGTVSESEDRPGDDPSPSPADSIDEGENENV